MEKCGETPSDHTLIFFVLYDIQCSFATLKASDRDSFTIPGKQSFL